MLFALGAIFSGFVLVAEAGLVLFLAAVVVDLFAGPPRGAIEIDRLESEPFALRRSASLQYRLRNRSGVFVRLGVLERPSRLFLYDDDEIVATVAPETEAIAQRTVQPIARGYDNFSMLYAWFENPIGFVRRRLEIPAEQTMRVYPDLSAVERYGNLRVRNRVIEAGLRKMRLRGLGTELESVREWSAGDAFRSIHWKASARRGRLMVADYEVERSQNVMLVLDAGRLMLPRVDGLRKLDYAVTAALSVASIAALASDKVGLVAFAREILRAYAPRAGGARTRLAEALGDLEPRFEESEYRAAFAYIRTHVHKRGLIVFFTDMIDPVAQSAVLAEIGTLARRHAIVCVFMNDAAIERTLRAQPRTTAQAYELAVALELHQERRAATALLERLGIYVVDVPARDLSTALIDRYLQIKQRGVV